MLALGLAALSAQACRWRRGNEIVLGHLGARTGDRAIWGEDLHRGLELAVEQQNARGGINGRKLRLVALDDESHEDRATSLTARLIEREGAVAVFGELSSVVCERAAAAAQRRSVVFIAPACTARDVSRVGEFVFRTALTDNEQAEATARFARQNLQKRKGAIMYRRSSLLHVGMADSFVRGFRAGGGEIVLRDSYADDAELVRLVGRVRAAGAEVIYAPADATDAGHVAVAVRQGRLGAQILGSDGWSSAEVRRFAQESIVGVRFTDAFSSVVARPEVEAFVTAFSERYRARPGTFAALGYDAARWVIEKAARIPQLDSRALRDSLAGSRLEDGVAGEFAVNASRALTRGVNVLRYTHDGVELDAAAAP